MRTIKMKMAKASPEEFRATADLVSNIESLIEFGCLHDAELAEDDPGLNEEQVDAEIARLIREHQDRWSLARVIWGFKVLVDACCDPDASTLEWRKDLAELIAAHEKENAG